MKRSACIVGNSSSAIREGAFVGVPSVNIGTRQQGRQRGKNVIEADHERGVIADAIGRQLRHGPYSSDALYGDGRAGERIAEILSSSSVEVQKRITY